MLEIMTLGGYGEVGRNSTAIKVDNTVVIMDLGLKMEEYVELNEDGDCGKLNARQLIDANAVPNIDKLGDWKKKVKAIILGHAHLDHIGAVPYLASKFNCPIYGSPYTMEVLKSILKDKRIKLSNELITHEAGDSFRIDSKVSVDFINMTHSVPDALIVNLKTKYGDVLYANDFKIDLTPTIGAPFSKKRIKDLNPRVLIMDSLYADNEAKTPSENVAKTMLQDLFKNNDFSNHSIFITTFASHISRLKTLVEIAKKIKRKPVFLGRSLSKYVDAAKVVGYGAPFQNVPMVKYGIKIKTYLMNITNPEKYLFVVTGHQGEPKATLSKLTDYYKLIPEDVVIFSCTTIPTEITLKNRKELEEKLKTKQVRMFKDIHVSGHGSREDIGEFIKLVDPDNIISSHAPEKQMSALKTLAEELKYDDENIILAHNGELIEFDD